MHIHMLNRRGSNALCNQSQRVCVLAALIRTHPKEGEKSHARMGCKPLRSWASGLLLRDTRKGSALQRQVA